MFNLENYTLIALWFPRLLGMIYFFVFSAFLFQMTGLFGQNGILPIKSYLEAVARQYPKKCYYYLPTLFWLRSDDISLNACVILGTLCSVLLIFGILPSLMILLLYILFISIVSAGQDFLSFGWDVFILEVTINAFFLSLTTVPNLMVWISINLLLFRFHLEAGAVKLQSRDKTWKDLTALAYHYQTQPLPNTVAWYIHKFPLIFHKMAALLMFITELVVPFAIFAPEGIRVLVFFAFFGLQYSIWLTGNFAYLNHLTIVLSTVLLSNSFLALFFEIPAGIEATPLGLELFLSLIGLGLIFLQILQLWNHFLYAPLWVQKILSSVSPFHVANRYGIFAVMTTKRIEIVVEGSEDGLIWKEYQFKYKPGELDIRPKRVSPYHPRLDWQAWFLPFSSFQSNGWFQLFLVHLLKGSMVVLKLLKTNPFPEKPPKYIRALAYEYEFTSGEELKESGNWWKRTLLGAYSPSMALREPIN